MDKEEKSGILWFLPLLVMLATMLAAGWASAALPVGRGNSMPTGQAQQAARAAKPAKPQIRVQTGKVNLNPQRPTLPNAVLYDQYDNPGTNATNSQEFPDMPTYTDQAADDFVVPTGLTWGVSQVEAQGAYFNGDGPADYFNLYFYSSSGTLPGTPVYTATNLAYNNSSGDFVITLTTPANLAPGSYFLSVQAHMAYNSGGQWGWQDRTLTSNNPAAWRNPGGGFGACPNWGVKTTCAPGSQPDQVFRLNGTLQGTPTNTPGGATSTSTTSPTSTATVATATATICPPNYTIASTTGSVVLGTDLVSGSRCDDCVFTVPLPFPVTFYGVTYTSASGSSNGNLQFNSSDSSFSNSCLPSSGMGATIFPYWIDLDASTCTGCGTYTATVGTAPNRTFYIEWRTQTFKGSNPANFEVVFHENNSTGFSIVYGVNPGNGGTAAGAQASGTGPFVQYTCNGVGGPTTAGTWLDFVYTGCGTVTATATTTPTATNTPTGTATAIGTPTASATGTATPCTNGYAITASTGTIISGTTDLGNHCEDCDTSINLPFPFALYGQSYTTAAAGSNGYLSFGASAPNFDQITCLPNTYGATYTIAPFWVDQDTTCTGCGIFTSTTGTSPNRVFHVEWRNQYFFQGAQTLDYEVNLYEGQTMFDVVYGLVTTHSTDSPLTVGVQKDTGNYTEYGCDPSGGTNPPVATGQRLSFMPAFCGTSTPTSTPASTSIVVGHVTWQGRPPQPNPLQVLPLTLTLKSSLQEVNYPVQYTDASGYFTVSVSTLPPGAYNWRVKSAQVGPSPPEYNPGWLAMTGTLTLTGAPITNVEMGSQRAGDCDNNNLVNSPDFIILKNAFGKSVGQVGYDNRADFTGDQVIGSTDFVQLKNNFGLGGGPPISPTGP